MMKFFFPPERDDAPIFTVINHFFHALIFLIKSFTSPIFLFFIFEMVTTKYIKKRENTKGDYKDPSLKRKEEQKGINTNMQNYKVKATKSEDLSTPCLAKEYAKPLVDLTT